MKLTTNFYQNENQPHFPGRRSGNCWVSSRTPSPVQYSGGRMAKYRWTMISIGRIGRLKKNAGDENTTNSFMELGQAPR